MLEYNIPEITKNVYYVGVKDPNRRLFDALIPLPQGTTYNSYLIEGEKKALIDTVNPGFEQELESRINQVNNIENIDYLVMNHAEPDHAGAIPHILDKNEKTTLVTSKRGKQQAQIYYRVPEKRIKVVSDGEKIDLGGKTLRFIEAPMLHWPETMFTYLEEDKILFPCDFLGLHTAYGFYDDEVPDLLTYAKRYFGEIMMPYRAMGKRALGKLEVLDIEMIAPSHGPIHRTPETIMEAYDRWTGGETEEKAILVYVSMWGSNAKMITAISEALASDGIDVRMYDLANADIGDVAMDLVDSRAVVLGVPTVLGRMHPLGVYACHLVGVLKPPLKYGVVLSSYGWGKGALTHAAEMLGPTGIEVVGTMEINGSPSEDNIGDVQRIAKELAMKIKS